MARRIAVLLNAKAGAVLDAGADTMRDALREGLHKSEHLDIQVLPPKQLIAAIAGLKKSDHDLVVIGGGDGSVNAAAQTLAGTGKTLGILPFGTLNLLARDLGIPDNPQDAIAALARSETQTIDLARLNGRYFHSMSGIGFFSQMARAREELRSMPGKVMRMASAAIRAFSRTGRFAIAVKTDTCQEEMDCYALLVTCNAFTEEGWRRESLCGGVLEVHAAKDRHAFDRIAAMSDLLTGRWRDNPNIRTFKATQVQVNTARRRIWVSTDGELRREDLPLRYEISPQALKVLRPAEPSAS